jgi:hypothetical protein
MGAYGRQADGAVGFGGGGGGGGLDAGGAVVAPEAHDGDGALGLRQQRRRQAAAGRPPPALPHRAVLPSVGRRAAGVWPELERERGEREEGFCSVLARVYVTSVCVCFRRVRACYETRWKFKALA